MPETIAIRNPAIRELVDEEQKAGVGRSATETAENLIRDGAEYRRIRRAKSDQPARRRPAKQHA